MSVTASFSRSNKNGNEIIVECNTPCNGRTSHLIISGYEESDSSPGEEIWVWRQYYIIQCQGCKSIRFLKEEQCSEFQDPNTGDYDNEQIIYPISLIYNKIIHDSSVLPNDIKKVYVQIQQALANDLLILATAGMRLIIEAIVKERDLQGKDLQEKINDLFVKGHIAANGIPVLQRIRIFGNYAIHDIRENTKKELLGAFNVIEFMLLSIYILPNSVHGPKVKLPKWHIINELAGKESERVSVEKLENKIKSSFEGGKLDIFVNPDAVKDLINIILRIEKSIYLHDFQRRFIEEILNEYIKECKEND